MLSNIFKSIISIILVLGALLALILKSPIVALSLIIITFLIIYPRFFKYFFSLALITLGVLSLIYGVGQEKYIGSIILSLILFSLSYFTLKPNNNNKMLNNKKSTTKSQSRKVLKEKEKSDSILEEQRENNREQTLLEKKILDFKLSDKSKDKEGFYRLNFVKQFKEDYKIKLVNSDFFFKKYIKVDGDWIEKGTVVCYITALNNNFPIYSEKSGYLEYILSNGNKLSEGQKLYKIHNEGEYKKQNSKNNDFIHHYCPSSFEYHNINWLVNDGDVVIENQNIYKVGSWHLQKAEKNGFIDINFDCDKTIMSKLYTIRNTDEIRTKNKYKNKANVTFDEFSKTKIIKWDKVSTLHNGSKGINSKSDDQKVDFIFTFNSIKNKDYIVFLFNPKQIKLRTNDKISFLFENDKIITYTIDKKPLINIVENNEKEIEVKSLITKSELELFLNINFKKWKITLSEQNKEILGGNNGLKNNYYHKNNLIIVIKKFAKDYLSIVKSEIINYKPLEFIPKKTINDNEKCYVYLMHDTTNNFYKIGISNNPEYREKTLQSEKPTIELISAKEYPIRKIAESFEKALHNSYSEKRIRGEWFELDETDIENIRETLK